MLKVATHSGSFHADDVFAVLVLKSVIKDDLTVVRTRDADIIRGCDYAVDVGGEYEPGLGRFDHHQKGFAMLRPNGIPFAAAGLVWRHYGSTYIANTHPMLTEAQVTSVVQQLDNSVVQHMDALDTGYRAPADMPTSIPLVVDAFNLTWRQLGGLPEDCAAMQDHRFEQAVTHLTGVFDMLVTHAVADVLAATLVRRSELRENGRIVVLTTPGLPWYDVVCNEMPEARFVVYPDSTDEQFQVRVVPVNPTSYTARLDLPLPWAGLRDANLAYASGVPDAVFCHNGRFIAGAKSKEGAIALAKAALVDAGLITE